MRREDNNNDKPLGDIFSGFDSGNDSSSEFEFPGISVTFDPSCDMIRPFNILWETEKVKDFLIARGYKVITRKLDDESIINIALKPDENLLPETMEIDNMMDVFELEIQDILLSWLLKIGRDNN